MMRTALKFAIGAYRRTPFHPHLTGPASKVLAAIQGEKIVRRCVHGFDIYLDTSQWIDSVILNTGTFEPETMKVVRGLLKPGMGFVDVGANIGWFSLYASEIVGDKGWITAYEPSDWTYDRLIKNIRLNNFENITARRAAVGRESDSVELVLPCGYRLDGTNTATTQQVDIVSLDDDFEMPSVDLIKIDTDGYEVDVINGAREIIKAHKPHVIFEVIARTPKEKTREVMGFFRDQGYRIFDEAQKEEVQNAHERVLQIATGTMNLIALAPGR